MKVASLLVLLPLLVACSPQSGQTPDNTAAPAAAAQTHAVDASAPDVDAADAHAVDAHAADEAAGTPKNAPANGWTTDAPLREGMGRIRLSVDALGEYEQGHMGAEQAVAIAADVEKDVNFLIANCKLDPDADAALHGIIAKLLKGAHALKADPADVAAIAPMREAMADYAATFDDPAFRADLANP